jgi:hypothetical protein
MLAGGSDADVDSLMAGLPRQTVGGGKEVPKNASHQAKAPHALSPPMPIERIAQSRMAI